MNLVIAISGLVWGQVRPAWVAYCVAMLISFVLQGNANVIFALYSLVKVTFFV